MIGYMSDREDTVKVLFAVVLIGSLVIALINYGCGIADDEGPVEEPLPAIMH